MSSQPSISSDGSKLTDNADESLPGNNLYNRGRPRDLISAVTERDDNVHEAIAKLKEIAIQRIEKRAAETSTKREQQNQDNGVTSQAPNSTVNKVNDKVPLVTGATDAVSKENSNTTASQNMKGCEPTSTPRPVKKIDVNLPVTSSNDLSDNSGRPQRQSNHYYETQANQAKKNTGKSKLDNASVPPSPEVSITDSRVPQTEDGFKPEPWVKRRYTIAQLLLLGQILPYVICSRAKFDMHAFDYGLVHIPGLGNESSGNALVDHQILSLNLRTEIFAFQYFSKFHYRYLDRFKTPQHALFVKGLWVEVRGSAGLRDHGGYRNAYRPKQYNICVDEGLIKENQELEVNTHDQRSNNQFNNHNPGYRGGRGSRGGNRGGSYRGVHSRGPSRTNFVAAMTEAGLKENITLPALSHPRASHPPTPIVGNDIAQTVAQEMGTLVDISKTYADIQLARTEIDHRASNLGYDEEAIHQVEHAREQLAGKKADVTNKWGGIYGYALKDQYGNAVTKPKGLAGNSTTQEQQMQYIQYMLQTPLAPVVDTIPAQGKLSSSLQLSQRLENSSDDYEDE